ncbi:peptidase M75 [Candidatus Poribacteria bacterium]|nr:MAG: peptidase M75 [Candidatus Poribacteria bacterium]
MRFNQYLTKFFCCSLSAFLVLSICLIGCSLTGCGSDDEDDEDDVTTVSESEDEAFEAGPILGNYANAIILATYTDLDNKAGELLGAVQALGAATNQAHLELAQSAWKAARIPWEQSEAWLFGPVDTQGLDPALDSWPVNKVDLDGVLGSDQALTEASIDALEDTLKGFHTIEYLLFREGDQRKAEDISPRELEYLAATTENLKAKTAQLANAWAASGENYAGEVANAGTTSTIYKSQKDAMQEMVNGMIVIADEVANGKISDPFNEKDTTLVESQFSFNSIADFQDNIRGIQNVYMGKFTADGQGLNDFVNGKDAELDARFQTEVQTAIDTIGAIPDPFRDSITANRGAVQAAIDAVSTVQQTLENDILKLVLDSNFN